MNPVQKVAWTELIVSVLAIVLVATLYPWLGSAALGGFALLGLLGITPLFLRRRGNQVVRDERDAQIEQIASWFGFGTAYFLLMLSMVAITLFYGQQQRDVPTSLLSVLLWSQFAFCYAIKGATALLQYRGTNSAA